MSMLSFVLGWNLLVKGFVPLVDLIVILYKRECGQMKMTCGLTDLGDCFKVHVFMD